MGLYRFYLRHPRVQSALCRLLAPQLECVCQMRFVVRFDGGALPDYRPGPSGRELACYVPDGENWQQVNFGQREGQALVDGREWGFYLENPDAGELTVVLHDGDIAPGEALAFAERVAAKVAGGRVGFRVVVRGNTYLRKRASS
jgi:hypothetical protein